MNTYLAVQAEFQVSAGHLKTKHQLLCFWDAV